MSGPIVEDPRQAEQAYAVLTRFAEQVAPLYADRDLVYEVWYGFRCTDDETGLFNLDFNVRNYHKDEDAPRDDPAWQDRLAAIEKQLKIDRYLFGDGGDWGVYGDWSDSTNWPKAIWYGEQNYTPKTVAALPKSMRYARKLTNRTRATDRAARERGLGVRDEPSVTNPTVAQHERQAPSATDMNALASRLARGLA